MSASRPIRLPAADFAARMLPTVVHQGTGFLRIHNPKFSADGFWLGSSHRFSHPDASGGLLYLGEDFDTCVWEVFGDEILNNDSALARSDLSARCLSRVKLTTVLNVCDLTEMATRRALGVDLSALKHTDLDIPQAWGLAIQNHPQAPDGLRYNSRFTDRPCLALFQRPGLAAKLTAERIAPLSELPETEHFLRIHAIALL